MPKVRRRSRNYLTSPPKAFGVDSTCTIAPPQLEPAPLCIRSNGRRSCSGRAMRAHANSCSARVTVPKFFVKRACCPARSCTTASRGLFAKWSPRRVEVVNSPSHTLPGRDALAITGRPWRRLLLRRRENGPNREHEESCTRCPHKLSGTYRFS
jgi:hypothetical protein